MSRSDGTDGRAHVRYGAESVYVVGTTPQESGAPVSGERRRRSAPTRGSARTRRRTTEYGWYSIRTYKTRLWLKKSEITTRSTAGRRRRAFSRHFGRWRARRSRRRPAPIFWLRASHGMHLTAPAAAGPPGAPPRRAGHLLCQLHARQRLKPACQAGSSCHALKLWSRPAHGSLFFFPQPPFNPKGTEARAETCTSSNWPARSGAAACSRTA